jgi:hypothetical protein
MSTTVTGLDYTSEQILVIVTAALYLTCIIGLVIRKAIHTCRSNAYERERLEWIRRQGLDDMERKTPHQLRSVSEFESVV